MRSTRAPLRQSAAVPPHIADVEQPVKVPAVLPVAERVNVLPSFAVSRRKYGAEPVHSVVLYTVTVVSPAE